MVTINNWHNPEAARSVPAPLSHVAAVNCVITATVKSDDGNAKGRALCMPANQKEDKDAMGTMSGWRFCP